MRLPLLLLALLAALLGAQAAEPPLDRCGQPGERLSRRQGQYLPLVLHSSATCRPPLPPVPADTPPLRL